MHLDSGGKVVGRVSSRGGGMDVAASSAWSVATSHLAGSGDHGLHRNGIAEASARYQVHDTLQAARFGLFVTGADLKSGT